MSNNLDIDIRKLTLPNGRTLEKQMKYEAKRFLTILQEKSTDGIVYTHL